MWSAAGWWDLSYPTDHRSSYIILALIQNPRVSMPLAGQTLLIPPILLQWVMFNLNLSALGKMDPK